ncbi:MAG: undecaprenyldiphospho-muramoylpentapeptide beta-N-acetylglucosaminyltransferase [Candidatus Neomarinimicrobiota bacterium]
MDKNLHIIIAGGGTGGHLFPAIAIGEAIIQHAPKSHIQYLGSQFGIEANVLPVKSLPHSLLPIRGLNRSITFKSFAQNLILPFRLFASIKRTRKLFDELTPDIVIGTGGYASAIPIREAIKRKIPLVIQEQNLLPGLTTKMFSDKASRVCVAFPESAEYFKNEVFVTGNPVRIGIQNGDRKRAAQRFNLNEGKKTIFLFGGSQGSRALNRLMELSVDELSEDGFQILWQTGPQKSDRYKKNEKESVRIKSFIYDMADAYSISDLIISRSGALTLSEITLCGKASILIPFPHAAADHQTINAKALSEANAAVLIPEHNLTAGKLIEEATALLNDEDRLTKMAQNSKSLGKPDATEVIVNHILDVARS